VAPSSNKNSSADELTRKSTTRQALYRKYRSKNFDEVIGQAAITTTLQNAIKGGRISHAYLFSGPRGVGKTSVARILAHQVNQLPYQDDQPHLDIIEIDAASNRRIDEIRDLRERVHLAPIAAKYKVYIIDEAHMLTREAFNALLKTLEEPPSHVIFILATTEAHKLPATIISRTQHFSFKPIGTNEMAAQLGTIARREKFKITPAALELLAEAGEGSFRDALSLLDQLGAPGQSVDEPEVLRLLGRPRRAAINELVAALETADHQPMLQILEQLAEQGVDPTGTAKQLAGELRQKLLASESVEDWLVELLSTLVEVPASLEPAEALELALLNAVARPAQASTIKDSTDEEVVEPPPIAEPVEPDEPEATEFVPPSSPVAKDKFELADDWPAVLEQAKSQAPALYTALRLATPALEADILTLSFAFQLHQKKVNSPAAKQTLETIIKDGWGTQLKVKGVIDKARARPASSASTASTQADPEADSLAAINSIFGGGEVLESERN